MNQEIRAWPAVTAWLSRRRLRHARHRLALIGASPSDLSETGNRERTEVLRDARTRALLLALDDRTLKDIGLTRADLLIRSNRR
jgi:uncharacterized protein YjiS (DUF1127 family)